MRARLHIWERGPCVDFDAEMKKLLDEEWPEKPLWIALYRDRVEMRVDASPIGPGAHVVPTSAECLDPFRFQVVVRSDYVVRCRGHEVHFKTYHAGVPRKLDTLVAALPAPYHLPWPVYRDEEGPYDKRGAALREVRVRLQEIRRDGLEPSQHLRAPREVQELLTAQERVRLFSEWTL